MSGSLIASPKPWRGPAPDWTGGWIPWNLIVGYSDDALLVIREAEVYPNGIEFLFRAQFRSNAFHLNPLASRPELPGLGIEGGLHLSARFADGRRTVDLSDSRGNCASTPPGPVLVARGGSGSLSEFRIRLWLWPLPPPGLLTWSVAWPQCGVSKTDTLIDVSDINAVASQALPIWTPETA